MAGRRREFRRFRDLDLGSVQCDLQIHTSQTDGECSIEQILRAAVDLGLNEIAFTEHVRRDTTWFPAFRASVREAALRCPGLRVLVGCEAKALDMDGVIDASTETLDCSEIVLGSIHSFPGFGGDRAAYDALSSDDFAGIEHRLARAMIQHAPIDVYAHPGGVYERRFGAFPEALMADLMELSLVRGIAVEINSSYLADPDRFRALCADINPYVSIGSDVHKLQELGRCRDMLLGWIS